MRAEVLAVVAGFVAVDEFKRARVVAERAEGEGRDSGGVLMGLRGLGLTNFVLESGFFHAPDAHLAPAGHGHVFDERGFEGSPGLVFFVERG